MDRIDFFFFPTKNKFQALKVHAIQMVYQERFIFIILHVYNNTQREGKMIRYSLIFTHFKQWNIYSETPLN